MRLKTFYLLMCWLILFHPVTKASRAAEFESHQAYISALSLKRNLDINDPAAVLKFVLEKSAQVIKVQPTENYAYFKFYHDGLRWQGNMRLETEKGQSDRLHFAYFVAPAPWHDVDMGKYKSFDKNDGMEISARDRFTYTIRFRGISRSFQLNNISNVIMAKKMLGSDETYMGQVNDESGLRFFLLFDKTTRDFSYILDQSSPFLDKLTPYGAKGSNLTVGIRSGFVFIDEPSLSRKRLVGVYSENITQNNYFDGPFDQLPDAYKGQMSVKQAFELIDSEFARKIDDFGNFIDREGARVVIAPYLRYEGEDEFASLIACGRFLYISVDYRNCIQEALDQ